MNSTLQFINNYINKDNYECDCNNLFHKCLVIWFNNNLKEWDDELSMHPILNILNWSAHMLDNNHKYPNRDDIFNASHNLEGLINNVGDYLDAK